MESEGGISEGMFFGIIGLMLFLHIMGFSFNPEEMQLVESGSTTATSGLVLSESTTSSHEEPDAQTTHPADCHPWVPINIVDA